MCTCAWEYCCRYLQIFVCLFTLLLGAAVYNSEIKTRPHGECGLNIWGVSILLGVNNQTTFPAHACQLCLPWSSRNVYTCLMREAYVNGGRWSILA